MLQHVLAVFGQAQAPGGAQQQGLAQLLLQPADLMADRRLGEVQAFAGAGEAAALMHRDQGPQQGGIDIQGRLPFMMEITGSYKI